MILKRVWVVLLFKIAGPLTVGFFKGWIEVHNSLWVSSSLVGGGGGGILMMIPVKFPELVSIFTAASRILKKYFSKQ
jgi:hypothetical protein